MREPRPLSRKKREFLAGCCLLALYYFFFFRAPTEGEMIAKFHQRKAEFEQIRLMLEQDKNVETIGPSWVEAKSSVEKDYVDSHKLPLSISESRIALYRSRLKNLGFSRVNAYKGRIQLEEFGGGFTDTSWGIGYIWSAQPPTPLVESAYSSRPQKDYWHYSRLEGNWYLYHRR